MKSQLIKITCILCLLTTTLVDALAADNSCAATFYSKNSSNSIFNFFRAHRSGKASITTTWGVSNSNGIVSFKVLKTYDDPNESYAYWETVGVVANSNASSYKFTDPNVFPGYISYKIIAVLTDGTAIATHVDTVHIVSH
jgi:hypothetical protein